MYLLKYLFQVVNDEIKDAFDEFVTKWVEDDLQRRLGPNQDPDNVPEEEMAILSLEAKEGGASLHKRIMDYTSRDFSARTDPTTAIVNAASRHLD